MVLKRLASNLGSCRCVGRLLTCVGCCRHKVPIVTLDWVLECVRTWEIANEGALLPPPFLARNNNCT